MPLYEYACQQCGHVFEARQKFSDPPLSQCPSCSGPVEKLISRSGFALKGGGWYDQGYSAAGSSPAPSCPQASGACSGCPKAS
ncbi:MAG: zinc ribbon domain-containing protein [Desulfuromonadaceae bacterium]|nr:zinc ribbon domain-containing protein [Desulfuromonadaceae bacterium]